MVIRRIEDISRDREKRKKEKFKKEMSDDIVDVVEDSFNKIEDFFKRKGIEKELADSRRGKVKNWIWGLVRLVGFIGLILLVINFLLGNLWLLKFFIKSFLN